MATLAVATAVAGLGLLASAAGAQVPPPTLTGEELTATPDITTNCNPNGTSTVMFSASGVATGPGVVGRDDPDGPGGRVQLRTRPRLGCARLRL